MESVIKGLQKLNCHFTWALEGESNKLFDQLWDKLISRIEDPMKLPPDRPQKNTNYISGKCLQVYLHLSSLNKNSDPNKALKDIEELLTELEQMEKLTPNEKKAYEYILFANRAWALYRSSAISDAGKALDELDQKYPVSDIKTPEIDARINGCKGYALSRFGPNKYDEAIRCFRQAVEILPKNGVYWGQMAIVLNRQGRQQRSKELISTTKDAFEKSIQFNSSDGIILAEYGRFLFARGAYQEAEELFRKAEEVDPNSLLVLQYIGEYYSKRYKYGPAGENMRPIYSKKAIEYYQRTMNIVKSTFTLHKLGKVYEDTGDIEKALKYYDEALVVCPTNASAKMDKAKVLFYKFDRKDEARRLMTQLIDNAGSIYGESNARFLMGEFLIKEGKIKDGWHQFRESIKLHSEGYHRKDATKKYIKYLRDELDSLKDAAENSVDILCELGWCHGIILNSDVAWQYYFLAYEHKNSSKTQKAFAASHLLEIHLKNKRIKEAGDWVKRTERKDLQICYYKEAAAKSNSGQDHFQACIELSEAVKLGSIKAAEILMKILIEHNDNLREKDWWGFYRFCGRVSILCDTDSKRIFENDETVSQIEERKNKIRPEDENTISELFPNSWKCLISLYKKCISLAKEDLSQQETEEKSFSILLQTAISELLVEARSLLDKIMAKFQEIHYPDLTFCSKFMFIPGENVKKDLRIHLEKKQGWKEFSGKFLNLFEYLVKIQPGNEVNHWLRLLFAIRNEIQHQKDASDIKLPEHKIKVKIKDEDNYIFVNPIDLAVKSGEEVEKIVKLFYEVISEAEKAQTAKAMASLSIKDDL